MVNSADKYEHLYVKTYRSASEAKAAAKGFNEMFSADNIEVEARLEMIKESGRPW